MKIVQAYPPNYALIRDAFGLQGKPGIVFTYGDTLYNPSGGSITSDLMAHEEVHSHQQEFPGPEQWWKLYLIDPAFRLFQETQAYRAQYRALQGRAERRKVLNRIAADLAGPIYGNIITKDRAKELIMEEYDAS